jgi:hypothetical protein
MNKLNDVVFRDYNVNDMSFIKSSWSKNQFHQSTYKKMSSDDFFRSFSLIINSILSRPTVMIIVACNCDYPDQIFGYSIIEFGIDSHTLHFVYVKGIYRGFGLSRKMIDFSLDGRRLNYYTCQSDSESWNFTSKKLGAKYNPFLLTQEFLNDN